MDEEKKIEMPSLTMSLYDLNKSAYKQQKPLSKMKRREALEKIGRKFKIEKSTSYYILLCKERSYYTVFKRAETAEETFVDVLEECLNGLGEVIDIVSASTDDAHEIWIRIGEEVYCFMLFDYSNGVIEVRG